jgi:ADP-heptose:LPS heptosyltransferase
MEFVTIGPDAPRWSHAGEVWPGMRYILPDLALETIREQERQSGYELAWPGLFGRVTKMWEGADTGTVLVYNTGAIGDQLWTTALVREMKRLHPRLEIDVVAKAETDLLWWSLRNAGIVRSVRLAPLPAEAVQHYDYTLFFDEVTMQQMSADQKNCYQELFDTVGMRMPDNVKPFVRPLHEHEVSAYHMTNAPDANGFVWRTRGHFVIGLHTSSAVRDLGEEQMTEFVAMLSAQVPDQKIYCLSNNSFGAGIGEKLAMLPNVISVNNRLNLLQIAALCRYASCVISPDSMLVHLAASQDAPTVAIMSTVGPQYRVGTYRFCVPIYNARECRYGDCFYKRPKFRFQLGEISETTKCYTPARIKCDVVASVTTQQIFEAMNMAIKRKNDESGFDQSDLPME